MAKKNSRNFLFQFLKKPKISQILLQSWNFLSSNSICNHNYNKILKSGWLSTALISALTGQYAKLLDSTQNPVQFGL